MQLSVLMTALLRRWYLLLVVLAASALAAYLVVTAVGPTYQATGAVLVMPPATTVRIGTKVEANGNPYLALGGLSQVRDIAIRSLTSQDTSTELCRPQSDPGYETMRQQLCSSDPKVTYEVAPDFTNSAPIVVVTVDADTPGNALVALDAVMNRVPAVLTELQQGMKLKADTTIRSAPLVADHKPDVVRKRQIRAGIVAGAGALGVGLLGVALLDGLLETRRSRRAQAGAQPTWWDEDVTTAGAAGPRHYAAAMSGHGPVGRG